jgi:protease-4
MFSIARSATDLEKAILARNVDSTYQLFLRIVAEGRKMPIARVDSIAQGRVWTGAQAKELGLVDELGGLEDAIKIAARSAGIKEGSYVLRILPHQKEFFEVLFDRLGTGAASLFSPSTPIDDYRMMIEGLQRYNGIQARGIDITIR